MRTGKVYGECRARRTAADLAEFMEAVARQYPVGDVYIVWDNLNIHHGEAWKEFNAKHGGRFHFVYTPKHASWENQIEIWFSVLQRRILRRGHFTSKAALVDRIDGFMAHWNQHEAHPFNWKFRGRFVHHQAQAA
jgi:transposase